MVKVGYNIFKADDHLLILEIWNESFVKTENLRSIQTINRYQVNYLVKLELLN